MQNLIRKLPIFTGNTNQKLHIIGIHLPFMAAKRFRCKVPLWNPLSRQMDCYIQFGKKIKNVILKAFNAVFLISRGRGGSINRIATADEIPLQDRLYWTVTIAGKTPWGFATLWCWTMDSLYSFKCKNIQGISLQVAGGLEYLHRALWVIRGDVKGTQCPGV
jgi:hypothetical protein